MSTIERRIAVVGLGYVGLPVAAAFGAKQSVVAFDISAQRIEELRRCCDRTGEVSADTLAATRLIFTSDPKALRNADFIIVAVPTPVDSANRPDLGPLRSACRTVGENLARGTIVVFESTVYPGMTEDECLPILERYSGLKGGAEFWVGYSPERINPGDREHTFSRIVKVVAGQTPEITGIIAAVYSTVVEGGVFRATSIKVAEAAKVIENTQRDLNIALMNELSLIFSRLKIDSHDVLAAAATKWNFLRFSPGLVGGHCIGVDPYYLTHKAEQMGYHPQVILAGRRINDSMGEVVADEVVKLLIRRGHSVRGTRVAVLGCTFKENVSDVRNSGAVRMIKRLREYEAVVQVADPRADPEQASREYGLELVAESTLQPADAVVLAVAHQTYVERGWSLPLRVLRGGEGIVADVRGILPRETKPKNVDLWRL